MFGHTGPRQLPVIALMVALVFAPSVTFAADDDPATQRSDFERPGNGHRHQVGGGAGIVVGVSGSDRFVLTNRAAVPAGNSCYNIGVSQVGFDPSDFGVKLVARDKLSGLVLLRVSYIRGLSQGVSELSGEPSIRPGQTIIAVGLPRFGGKYEVVSATSTIDVQSAPGDNPRLLKVTTPHDHLNNPGPLLDFAGNVVGMIIDRHGAMAALGIEREVPRTENFAVGTEVIRAFLDVHDVRYRTALPGATTAAADLAKKAYDFTLNVVCWD